MDISLIIRTIRKELNLSQEQFATKIGLKRSNLAHIETGRVSPSLEQVNTIVSAANINISVLFEILNSEEKLLPKLLPKLLLSEEIDKNDKVNDKENDKADEKFQEELAPVGRCQASNYLNQDCDITPVTLDSITPIGLVEFGGIPLIPVDAAAGFLSGDTLQVMDYECERYLVPSFKGAEFLIRVNGDSMSPKYESGDIVACMRLPLDTFFQWHKVYVIDSMQGVLIKRVNQAKKKDHILIVSDNPSYEPFELHRSEINSLGMVIGLIRPE